MQKYKAKKDVVEQVTSKLQASKIEKTLFNVNWDEILKSHKYSRKEFKNGKWIYYYDKHNNHARMTQCKSSLLNISYDKTLDPEIQTAMITGQAIDYIENVWLADWEKSGNENKSICKELRNKKIIFGDISYTHLWKQGGNSQNGARIRSPKNIMGHVPYLPCAKELLEDNGVWTESRYEPINKKHSRAVGIIYQTLSGISPIGSPKPYVSVTISQYKYKNGKKGDALYISVVGKDDIKKSLDKKNGIDLSEGGNKSFATKAAFCLTSPKSKPNLIIQKSNNMSSKIKPDYDGHNVLHKSFDITVTGITENNKAKKIEQVQKALYAVYENKPFVIKHLPADASSRRYDDITLRIANFDKSKIEKAVHKMAFSLDAPIKSAKGETFTYKSQEELTDKFVMELTEKTKAVYSFVIAYFGLPEIRIVSKADLTYKGKIIYDPESGKPISQAEWKKFVDTLEKYLNRNYSGVGKRIVLSAESLGRILERLSKTNSFEAVQKMMLDDLALKRHNFDWISDSVKNMHDALGESLDRIAQARIQVAVDSAAQRITKVTDNMRNDIQQIIIDGIKDKSGKAKISQNLFDKCAGLNRDFQRIADSEIQNTVNNAYVKEEVYNSKPEEKVYFKRFEIVDDNTCKKCKAIKGKIALWSDTALPDEKIKDPYADYAIWEGKTDGNMPIGIMHPYCYSADTEVMTNNGWKLFKNVNDNDLIMSINPETHEIDFVSYTKKISYQYDGDMIHFPGRNFDLLVTPDHNMLIEEIKSKRWHGISADELIKRNNYSIPRARGVWKGSNPEKIKIGDKEYSFIQYVKLWAWYLSEGNGRYREKDNSYEIKFTQKYVEKIINDIPEFKEEMCIGKDAIYFTGEIAKKFTDMYKYHAADKFIPDFIKNATNECIKAFIISFNLGDGSKRSRKNIENNSLGIKKSNDFVVRTSSKIMADDLCELIIKAGWMPSIAIIKQKGKEVKFRNGIYKLNTDCYVINVCKSKNKTYSTSVIKGHPERHLPYKLHYSGIVYDVELEKWHFLLVKRNGKCSWSGNCRGGWIRYYPALK